MNIYLFKYTNSTRIHNNIIRVFIAFKTGSCLRSHQAMNVTNKNDHSTYFPNDPLTFKQHGCCYVNLQVDNRQAVSAWLPVSFLDEFDSADIDSIFIANNSMYNYYFIWTRL